jgi:hypothetical protein
MKTAEHYVILAQTIVDIFDWRKSRKLRQVRSPLLNIAFFAGNSVLVDIGRIIILIEKRWGNRRS